MCLYFLLLLLQLFLLLLRRCACRLFVTKIGWIFINRIVPLHLSPELTHQLPFCHVNCCIIPLQIPIWTRCWRIRINEPENSTLLPFNNCLTPPFPPLHFHFLLNSSHRKLLMLCNIAMKWQLHSKFTIRKRLYVIKYGIHLCVETISRIVFVSFLCIIIKWQQEGEREEERKTRIWDYGD